MTDQTAIDVEFLDSVIDGDTEFERELFSIFVANAEKNVKKMEDSMANKDNNGWYMSSHAFKGAAASIGAFSLSKALEYAQKNPDDSDSKKIEVLAKIRSELDEVLKFINSRLKD